MSADEALCFVGLNPIHNGHGRWALTGARILTGQDRHR